MLKANRPLLDKLKAALIEHETLEEEEVADIMVGAKLPVESKAPLEP